MTTLDARNVADLLRADLLITSVPELIAQTPRLHELNGVVAAHHFKEGEVRNFRNTRNKLRLLRTVIISPLSFVHIQYDRSLAMRSMSLLLITVCTLTLVGAAQSKGAAAEQTAMTAGDLEKICVASSAESKAACRYYLLGVTQGVSMGMGIADGKLPGGRPCIPDNLSAVGLELAVKMKLGQELMVFPEDRKLDAAGVVSAVLITSFPCGK